MAYAKRYAGGFLDKPTQTTPIDSQYLNNVETALLELLSADGSVDGQVLQWIAAQSKFGPALLLNKNIDPAAAIDKSKLNLAGQIVNADISAGAAIDKSKLNFGAGLVNSDISTVAAIAGTKVLPARVATTVAGLGTAAEGAHGVLRIGGGATAPFYDTVPLVYDGTYAKWVSPVAENLFLGISRNTSSGIQDIPNTQGNVAGQNFAAKLSDYNAAGLAPQLRAVFFGADETGGDTVTFTFLTASSNDGAAGPGTAVFTTQFTSGVITCTTGNTRYGTRSGWQAVGTTALTNDILWAKATMNWNNAVHQHIGNAWLELRWVG